MMLPCMFVAMLHRREEYGQDHRAHHPVHRRRTFATFNRSVANPVTRLFAGRLPPFAVVRHRGRASGRRYATPVLAFPTGDGLVFALLYGKVSDWVKNALVADEVDVIRRGETLAYELPRLLAATDGLRLLPPILRPLVRLFRVRDVLLVSAVRR